MIKFIIRRVIQSIPTFFGITLLSYLIMVLAPGDPVSILTFDPNMSQEERDAMADRMGVNDPWPMQYFRWLMGDDWRVVAEVQWYQVELEDGTTGWLSEKQIAFHEETGDPVLLASRQPYRIEPQEKAEIGGRVGRRDPFTVIGETVEQVKGDSKGILRGDFGRSFTYRRDPMELIGERLWASLELNIATILVGITLGVPIGVMAAIMRGKAFDQGSRVLAVVGDSIPAFWLGIMLLMIFGAPYLDILPMGGRCDHVRGGCPPIYERLEYLILPTTVTALGVIAGWSRYIRASMLEAINSDYIRTAHAKGLSPRKVWFTHGLRNALIPMATFLGPTLVSLIGGSAIIESIFTWPGVGRLLLQAISAQDYPLVMASVVIGSVLTILGYLISDILYAVFDPRIRLD